MKGPFYEVAAITAYTGRAVQRQNEACFDISQHPNLQSNLPSFGPQVCNTNLNWHSTGDHVNSVACASVDSLNLRIDGLDSSSVDLSSKDPLFYRISEEAHRVNYYILSSGHSNDKCKDSDDEYFTASSSLASVKEANAANTQDQGLGHSSAQWKDKFAAALDNIFDEFPSQETANFPQPAGSLSCTSDSVGSWFESSIGHRKGSLSSSSYWGGSSAYTSTGVSLESDMDDCPLLASTMIEMDNKFTTEADLLEAMHRAQILADEDTSANANIIGESGLGKTQDIFHKAEENADKNSMFHVAKDKRNEIKNISDKVAETSSNFVDTSGKDEKFSQLVEENLKHVANQLFALQQANLTDSDSDLPKVKSYRDVLMGVPSAVNSNGKTGNSNTMIAKFPVTNSKLSMKNTNDKLRSKNEIFEQTKEIHLVNKSDSFLQLQNRTRGKETAQKSQDLSFILASNTAGNLTDSFYSAKSSASEPSTDGGSTSSSESGVEMYETAVSHQPDSGDESGWISEDLKTINDKNSGSLESTGRARKRHRGYNKQARNDSDSCATDHDVPVMKSQAYPQSCTVTSTAARNDSNVFSANDYGSNMRSSSNSSNASRDAMSLSRDSSSNSRSSSLSLSSVSSFASPSCTETTEPGTRRLNPHCPPFVPRASRLGTASSRTSVPSKNDAEMQIQDKVTSENSKDTEKSRIGLEKDPDSSLMPPPSSTKIPIGGNPLIRRIHQLRLSSSVPSDSGIDTTGQYNSSANISQSNLSTMHDSVFHEIRAAVSLDEGVFERSDAVNSFRSRLQNSIAPDAKTLHESAQTETCAEDHATEYSKANQILSYFKTNCQTNLVQKQENDPQCSDDLFEPSPYNCKLNHDFDFIPVSDLTNEYKLNNCDKNSILYSCLTPPVLNVLLPLSQRVVRVRVRKSLIAPGSSTHNSRIESDSDQSHHDHYGTGFVYNINKNFFDVRTHEAMVSSAEQAAGVEITFELLVAGKRRSFVSSGILDSNTADSGLDSRIDHHKTCFSSDAPYSQVTSFRRATPKQLVPLLHLFQPVPTKIRSSFFEDSCYFSDSSPDCSLLENSSTAVFQFSDQQIKQGTSDYKLWLGNGFSSSKTQTDSVLQHERSISNLQPNSQSAGSFDKPSSRLYQRKASSTRNHDDSCQLSGPKSVESTGKYGLVNVESFSWEKMVRTTRDIADALLDSHDDMQGVFGSKNYHRVEQRQRECVLSEETFSGEVNKGNDGYAVTGTFNLDNDVDLDSAESLQEAHESYEPINYSIASDIYFSKLSKFVDSNLEQIEVGVDERSYIYDSGYKWTKDDCQTCYSAGNYDGNSVSKFECQGFSVNDMNNNALSRLDIESVEKSLTRISLPNLPADMCGNAVGQYGVCRNKDTRCHNTKVLNEDHGNEILNTDRLKRTQGAEINGIDSRHFAVAHVAGYMQDNSIQMHGYGDEQAENKSMADTAHHKSDISPCISVHQTLKWKEGSTSCPLTPGAPASCGQLRRQKIRDIGNDQRPSSPLVIMERRAAAEGRVTMSGVGLCPYSGVDLFGQTALYNSFSSYAGDTMDLMRKDLFSTTYEVPRSDDQSSLTEPSWDFAKLLFAQNSHRKAYTRQFKSLPQTWTHSQSDMKGDGSGEDSSTDSVFYPDDSDQSTAPIIGKTRVEASLKNSDTEVDSTHQNTSPKYPPTDFRFRSHRSDCDGGKDVKRVFAPTDPFEDILDEEKYRASWDIDLLNLNSDLTPAQDPQCVESSLAHILTDTDETQNSCCRTSQAEHTFAKNIYSTDSNSDNFIADPRAIIISHPHGGRKMLSVGFFSKHYHVGGNLYDTPTCMGSCGAPVISLAEDGNNLHVTSMVHAGNVTVNGITTGMGVEFFPPING